MIPSPGHAPHPAQQPATDLPSGQDQARDGPPGVLLQISDPHFGTEQPDVVRALIELAAHVAPELVVWSGDITQRARRAQFAAAGEVAHQIHARTRAAVLAIPGNHDVPLFNLPARVLSPYRNYLSWYADINSGHATLSPRYVSRDWLVIGVKTTRRWRHKNGQVSDPQAEAVAAQLRSAKPTQRRVVVVHQPVHALAQSDRDNLVRGHASALPLWRAAGCDLIVGGHIHLPYVLEIPGPPHERRMWTAQAGTAVSTRTRGSVPNSVNVIRASSTQQIASARGMVVERWDYTEGERAFRLRDKTPIDA